MNPTLHDLTVPDTSQSLPLDGFAGIDGHEHSSPTWHDFQAFQEQVEKRADRRDGWAIFVLCFAAVAVLFGVIAIGLASRAIHDAKHTVSAAAGAGASTAPSASTPLRVTLTDFKVQLATTTVAAGNVTVTISNTGTVPHELLVFRSNLAPADYPMKDGGIDEEGAGITKISDGDNLDPGTSQTRTIDLTQPGSYMFVCNLPGHFAAGMYTMVTVK